jgi:hypothetical protein
LKVSGLTRTEALKTLQDKIELILKPIINLRIMNFKVSQGEVTLPGTYSFRKTHRDRSVDDGA